MKMVELNSVVTMEDLWVIGVLLITIFMGYYWCSHNKNEMVMKKKDERAGCVPRGSLGWPLMGESLDFIACGLSPKPLSFMDQRATRYGKVFKTHILGTPIIISTDADVNKVVLVNQGLAFIPAYPKSVRELLGPLSILQANGPLHRRLHSLLAAFLRSPRLKSRISRSIQHSVALSLASWTHHPIVYVQQQTNKIAFEVLVKVLMSIQPGEQLDILKTQFQEFVKGLICLPVNLPGTRLYKSLKAKEKLLKMVKKIVEERKRKSCSGSDAIDDAVDALVGDEGLPLEFICSSIIEMMIPGEDSVPTAITLAVHFLSRSPQALDLLVEENMKLKQHKIVSSSDYAWTDYMSLPFTQNVINETLRMGNILNGVWRKAVKDVEIKGHMIPKGWCVMASFSSVHMDQQTYENPYQFDPFRWEKMEGGVSNNKFTPFGGGQRLCPGWELSRLEISIFLHHFVTTYRWVAEEDHIVHFPTVKMKRSLPIVVTPMPTEYKTSHCYEPMAECVS